MKKAVAINGNHRKGFMQEAIIKAAKKINIDVLDLNDDKFEEKSDEYDYLVIFHNQAIFRTGNNVKTGWWMCDYREPQEVATIDGFRCDVIFLCNTQLLEDYKKKYGIDVYYMPQCGFDCKYVKGESVDWDIVWIGNFIGKYHENRWEIIEKLREKYNVRIVLGQGEMTSQWTIRTPQSRYYYHKTPFSLSISIPFKGYTSNRTYNILASKGLCLILYFPELEKLFENYKHLLWFKNVKEAEEIIDYYLPRKKERKKIQEEGFKLYQEKHTAEKRLQNMFDILEGKTNKFYGYLN